ncbi:MAG: hypothetical protein ABI807_10690 [Sporichthyaceae bacterium]
MVNLTPTEDKNIGFITYPADVTALTALVSFGVSGIYLSFLPTVIGAIVARSVDGSRRDRSSSGGGRGPRRSAQPPTSVSCC